MNYGLAIKQSAALDFISLGGIVYRLDPGIIPFRKAQECQIHVSGGEFNVAANLSDCFGLRTGIVTAMVKYPVGDLVAERVRAMGVTPFSKMFQHNGVTGPNIATVFSDRAYGMRAPIVFYNRANEAAAQLKPGDFDWTSIFGGGVRWFHSGGIFAALSESTPELIIEGMQAARSSGAVVSFDLNYRGKLWNLSGGEQRARSVVDRIVKHVDVLVGNEEDLQNGLGIKGPDATGTTPLDPTAFLSIIEKVLERYPHIKIIVTTLRQVHSTNRHSWGAVAWINGNSFVSPRCQLDVYDRIGGGDGFASGFFFGVLAGESAEEAVKLGWAHGGCSLRFPAIRPWPHWTKFGHLRRAERPVSNAEHNRTKNDGTAPQRKHHREKSQESCIERHTAGYRGEMKDRCEYAFTPKLV